MLKLFCSNSNYKDHCGRIANVWGIRTALEMYNQKLTHWNDTKIYGASDVQVTFMLTRDTVVVVRTEDDRLDVSDETMAAAAGIDFAFVCQECPLVLSAIALACLESGAHSAPCSLLMPRH